MIQDRHVWLVWSGAFLLPWLAIYVAFPSHRKIMRWASLLTAPLGLTEPLFVPAYWNPPSLFDLARTTGFDIESVIFSFGIGGIGAVLYDSLTGRKLANVGAAERFSGRHRLHILALVTPFVSFSILYWFAWNPIYPAVIALVMGAVAAGLCRPDLGGKIWIGSLLFAGFYGVFLLGVEWTAPGYIERVWNLPALSGFTISGVPVEELLFAASFGAYWSSVYDHLTWTAPVGQDSESGNTISSFSSPRGQS